MKIKTALVLTVFISLITFQVTAQDNPHFKLSVGVNVIDNGGEDQGPWSNDALDFKTPLALGVDYQVNNQWSFGVNTTFNKLEVAGSESNFFSMHADANYYIIPNASEKFLELYAILGTGFYSAFDNTAMTLNPGMGLNHWFSSNLGINFTAKAMVDLSENVLGVRNYYQYNLGLVWRLGLEKSLKRSSKPQ